MSLITYRLLDQRGQPTGYVYYLEFDAATVEEFTRSAFLTEYPVETGAVLSDHYQPQPRNITLEGVVSDTPARFYIPIENKINAAPPPIVTPLIIGNVVSAAVQPRPNRVVSFFEALDFVVQNRIPVTVTMLNGVEFRDMFIVDVRAPRVAGRGGSITFSIDLRQVITAPAAVAPAAAVRSEPEAQQTRARSRTATKPPSDRERVILDNLGNQGALDIDLVVLQ